jgi:hypothetical protein
VPLLRLSLLQLLSLLLVAFLNLLPSGLFGRLLLYAMVLLILFLLQLLTFALLLCLKLLLLLLIFLIQAWISSIRRRSRSLHRRKFVWVNRRATARGAGFDRCSRARRGLNRGSIARWGIGCTRRSCGHDAALVERSGPWCGSNRRFA